MGVKEKEAVRQDNNDRKRQKYQTTGKSQRRGLNRVQSAMLQTGSLDWLVTSPASPLQFTGVHYILRALGNVAVGQLLSDKQKAQEKQRPSTDEFKPQEPSVPQVPAAPPETVTPDKTDATKEESLVSPEKPPEPKPKPKPKVDLEQHKELIEEVAVYFKNHAKVQDQLVLLNPLKNQLRRIIINPKKIKDNESIQSKLKSLKRIERVAIANAALERLEPFIKEKRDKFLLPIADKILLAIEDRFKELSEQAFEAEEQEKETLAALQTPRQRRKHKKRVKFPLIAKYLFRHIIFRQIDNPKIEKKKYSLGKDYRTALGLSENDSIFPKLYEEDMIETLNKLNELPKSVRNKLKDYLKQAVVSKTLDTVSNYIQKTVSIGPEKIKMEYHTVLSDSVKSLIEGGLEGYFATRRGLINAFGSEDNIFESLKTANSYYDSLVKANFLKNDKKKIKNVGTKVHPQLKQALDNAEKLINKMGWQEEVVQNLDRYGSTNIRENRNAPTRLSQHSYGRAIDINPHENPNLAQSFNEQTWKFVEEFVGEDIYKTTGKEDTKVVETIKTESDTEKILEAVIKLRSQSDRFKQVFDNEENLRKRLTEILKERGIDFSSDEMTQLFDLAKEVSHARKKRKLSGQLSDEIFSLLWQKNPSSSIDITEEVNPLVSKIVKRLSRAIRTYEHYNNKKSIIESQIINPSKTAAREAKKLGLQVLFQKNIVNQLNNISESDRQKIAQQVLNQFKVKLDRKQIQAQTKDLAEYLKKVFNTFKLTTRKGEKIKSGSKLHNVAARGFMNLSPKLITALISPQGGNLKWLGVHNQDMHHFELKTYPSLPKAPVKKSDNTNNEPSHGTPAARELTL